MKLAALLAEIGSSSGPVTGIELASRLGITTSEVSAMLAALRASGALDTEPVPDEAAASCSSVGSCSLACPGPGKCALVIDLNVASLEIRQGWATRHGAAP